MLRPRQIRFCEEYLIDQNGTRAAKAAGYSDKNAARISTQNLQKEAIKEYLQQRQRQISKRLQITQDRVVLEYSKIAFFDIRKIYDENNQLKNVRDFDNASAAAVAGIETFEEDIIAGEETIGKRKTLKVKVADKKAALDGICKVLGFNSPDKVSHNIDGMPDWMKGTNGIPKPKQDA